MKTWILLISFSIAICSSRQEDLNAQDVVFGEVQSCRGCQLRGLPDVKDFIFEDLPLYDNAVFKPLQGAPPELILYDKDNKEVHRIPLREYTRSGCNELMAKYGFKKKNKLEL